MMQSPLARFEENLESILALSKDVRIKFLVELTFEINSLVCSKDREVAFDLMKDACRALRSAVDQDRLLIALAKVAEGFTQKNQRFSEENKKVFLDATKAERKTESTDFGINSALKRILNQVEHLPSKVAFNHLKDKYKTLLLSDADKVLILTAMARLLPNRADSYFHQTSFNFLKDACNALRVDADKVAILIEMIRNLSAEITFDFLKEACQALHLQADKVVLLSAIINRKDYLFYPTALDFIKDQYQKLHATADKAAFLAKLCEVIVQSYQASHEDILVVLNFIQDESAALCLANGHVEIFSAARLVMLSMRIDVKGQCIFNFIKDASKTLNFDTDKSGVFAALARTIHRLPKESRQAAFEFIVTACGQLHAKYQSKVLQVLAPQIAKLDHGYKKNHEYKKEAFYRLIDTYTKLPIRFQGKKVLKALARQIRYLPHEAIEAAENHICAMMGPVSISVGDDSFTLSGYTMPTKI